MTRPVQATIEAFAACCALIAPWVGGAAPAAPSGGAPAAEPVLISEQDGARMAAEAMRYPLFGAEVERTRALVDAAIRAGIDVPVPKDPGGGLTHEQHKRNYESIRGAGLLYRITGNKVYADHARAQLLAYAELYPKLGTHPAAASQSPGRLFWQSLNDSVWLVYAIQGYDAIRATLSAADRRAIDEQVFRRMARFLSEESPGVFNRIHNHATWAVAGVGMTGYVLRDELLVLKALKGLDQSGDAGFLRQLDLLFSPDGYYAEGPYYQRYALLPFVVFARAIATNEPDRRIFDYRDGILMKAVGAAIQLTHGGYFFPLNDALPDKSLRTEELYYAVAIAYAVGRDPTLLSIAEMQGRTVLTPDGLAVAADLAAGRQQSFPFRSLLLRDGPAGDRGAIAILRSGPGPRDQVLVMKNSSQGMGHGHFDKLSWILYDDGNAIVTDYGAARFLNVEAKQGGRYLPENDSWAKQTIAHNTLVVNETSHFGARMQLGEKHAPGQLAFEEETSVRLSTAEVMGTYPNVSFRRTLTQLSIDGLSSPVIVDLLRVKGDKPAQYDLPLHYAGHLIEVGFPLQSNVAERPVLGKANGYQHLWVDAIGEPKADAGRVTWMKGERFYTFHVLPPGGTRVVLAQSGANDPNFNLRREPVLIQRVTAARDATFISLLEPHGQYDAAAERTVATRSRIRAIRHRREADSDLITIETLGGRRVTLALSDDPDPDMSHRAAGESGELKWSGHAGVFEH